MKKAMSLEHIAHWRTLTDGFLVANLFSVPGTQPLVWRSPPKDFQWPIPRILASAARYEYVWSYGSPLISLMVQRQDGDHPLRAATDLTFGLQVLNRTTFAIGSLGSLRQFRTMDAVTRRIDNAYVATQLVR